MARPSENFSPSNLVFEINGGDPFLSGRSQFLYSSLPSSFSSLSPHQQPPLLPLPVPKIYSSIPSRIHGPLFHPINTETNRSKGQNRIHGHVCSPNNKKINRSKDQNLTPKKSKSSFSPKRSEEDAKYSTTTMATEKECLMIASTKRLGPDPSDLPKEASRVLKPVRLSAAACVGAVVDDMEKFSGSVFSQSPPPSSLPLPKFSVRPKLSCNAEAGGIDAGFSSTQEELYNLILETNKECIKLCRPGASMRQIHDHSVDMMQKGLKGIGILKDNRRNSQNYNQLNPTSIGHYLGMDVHDCSMVSSDRPLKPGGNN